MNPTIFWETCCFITGVLLLGLISAIASRKRKPEAPVAMDDKIERGIPIPPKEEISILDTHPEFAAMQIGDSILIPSKDFKAGMFILVACYGIDHGQRHTDTTYPNGDVRFWRVK